MAKKREWLYDTPSVNWSINAWVTLGTDQTPTREMVDDNVFVPLVATTQTCYCRTTSSVKDLLSIAEIEIVPSCCNGMKGLVMKRSVKDSGLVQFAIDLRPARDDLVITDVGFSK